MLCGSGPLRGVSEVTAIGVATYLLVLWSPSEGYTPSASPHSEGAKCLHGSVKCLETLPRQMTLQGASEYRHTNYCIQVSFNSRGNLGELPFKSQVNFV